MGIRLREATGNAEDFTWPDPHWYAAGPAVAGLAAAPAPGRCRVALGRSGIRANKREGDGATPRGRFRPVRLWWRADRLPRPRTLLPVRRIGPDDAWCEDPNDRRYNRPFRRSASEPGDKLWRDDASTTSSSKLITTPGHASPALAARCSSMSRARASRRPLAASRSSRATFADAGARLGPKDANR